jgi:hypothetical protein
MTWKLKFAIPNGNHDKSPTALRNPVKTGENDSGKYTKSHRSRALNNLRHQRPTLEGRESRDILKNERPRLREGNSIKVGKDEFVSRIVKCTLAARREALTRRSTSDDIDRARHIQQPSDRIARHPVADWRQSQI